MQYRVWESESHSSFTLLLLSDDRKPGDVLEQDAKIVFTFEADSWKEASIIYNDYLDNLGP